MDERLLVLLNDFFDGGVVARLFLLGKGLEPVDFFALRSGLLCIADFLRLLRPLVLVGALRTVIFTRVTTTSCRKLLNLLKGHVLEDVEHSA